MPISDQISTPNYSHDCEYSINMIEYCSSIKEGHGDRSRISVEPHRDLKKGLV